ncbi:MAG TPA: metalloregulator ArsR/SmtB family transcription factor [Candidatus Paceibacterota bacterium]|uniref:HTH arsR-type domain-containing protein n=1 Tax=Candidatus Ryanbacteria bacterium RIFCSPHIGHO2_01_FULL_45_22 TaxID=1802114 RepID=A0A1G2FX09_9BACT|nr:MAG: hypothetical protein A2719_01980 [Candidatus Ryanbacteria bacterium RIFCSPHIGHO2_01_FULL_45_22]
MKEIERNLKALANARRLKIVLYLRRVKKASVSDIAEEIKLSFKSTSRHLSVLASAGIISKEQVGLEVFNNISDKSHKIVSEVLKLM